MPPRSGKSPAAEAAFLECLAHSWSVTQAAQQAGIARETVYRWRAANKKFAAAWDHAIETGTDRLEDELHRRAVEGGTKTTEKVGDVVTVTQASDRLLMALLAARRPERYRPLRKALEIQARDEAHESARQRLERKLDRMAQALRAGPNPGQAE